jgi:Tol biopolymer transport system component
MRSIVRHSARRWATLAVLLTGAAFVPALAQGASRPGLIAAENLGAGIVVMPAGGGSADGWFHPVVTGAHPAWSPNGETLAFVDGEKIVLADRAGHHFSTLLTDPTGVFGLDWSPDGRKIAYMCDESAVTDVGPYVAQICVLDVVTGAHRFLTNPKIKDPKDGILGDPAAGGVSWSPKGKVIAFDSQTATPCKDAGITGCVKSEVALVSVKRGTVHQITDHDAGAPAFSPDGDEMSYYARSGPHKGLDVASASGGFIRRVESSANVNCGSCGYVTSAWSPDAKLLLFSAADKGRHLNLFTVGAHGGKTKQITNAPSDRVQPAWTALVTTCTVPKLKGETFAKAKKLIMLAGCTLGKVTGPKKNRAARHVVNQNPKAHKDVRTGTKINVQIR